MKIAKAILASKTCQNDSQKDIAAALNVNKKQHARSGHFLLYLSAKCPQTRPIKPLVKVKAVPVTKPNSV